MASSLPWYTWLTVAPGDTLTYTLGALKPETANADTVTADELAKQVALDKVGRFLIHSSLEFPRHRSALSLFPVLNCLLTSHCQISFA